MQVPYTYVGDALYCEESSLADIAAAAGTPCYVYSAAAILEKFQAYDSTFAGVPHQICYAVKANSNLAILRLLAAHGAGFDIVSGGELYRVLRAGGDPRKVVFSGVGKTAEEIEYALEAGIGGFNCESETELELINALAGRHGQRVSVALRVNPDVNAETHPYISTGLQEHKFGIGMNRVERICAQVGHLPNLRLEGVSCHIGSQLLDTAPIFASADIMLALAHRLRGQGLPIRRLDLGGGLGIQYRPEEQAPDVAQFVRGLRAKLAASGLELLLEPGRSIVGEAGALLTRVLYRKQTGRKHFLIVDAAMTELIRPALYQSYHEVLPVRRNPALGTVVADVVGPVCETGDFLARDREIANAMPGDLLAVCSAGAYGFVLASNYNSRPRPPEILVEGHHWRTVRARETYPDLVRGEPGS